MSNIQAIELAKQAAQASEWPWTGSIEATCHRRWYVGAKYWVVLSNADEMGMNVRIEIDDESGEIREKAFLPR